LTVIPILSQLEALRHYLDGGGNVLVMLPEREELKHQLSSRGEIIEKMKIL